MKPLHSLVTAALLLTSCSTPTPEQQRRRERADRVGSIVNSASAHFGLSPLERAMLERKARKIAGSEDPLNTGLGELDKHPKLEQKAWQWLQGKNAGDILGELGRENPGLEKKANEWLGKNPDAARRIRELLGQ